MSSRLHPAAASPTSDTEPLLMPAQDPEKGRSPASRRQSESANQDFLIIKVVARLALSVIRRFWAWSGAAVLSLLLFYWLYGGLLAFALVCFGVSGVLYKAGDRLLYHPDQPAHSRVFVPTPAIFGLPFENLFIRARDGVELHLFLVRRPGEAGATVPTILYLHGNAGNIGHRLLNVQGLYNSLGCNVALLEYRGYGRSEGSPSEEGLCMDAQAALDFLLARPDLASDKLVVFGRSLGGAVAVDLATRAANKERLAAVMLENTFTSIPDIARILFPFRLIKLLPVWAYKNQFRSLRKACRITQPTLFLSGLSDQGGSHNETWTAPDYLQTVNYFLDEVVYLHSVAGRPRLESPTSLVPHSTVHTV